MKFLLFVALLTVGVCVASVFPGNGHPGRGGIGRGPPSKGGIGRGPPGRGGVERGPPGFPAIPDAPVLDAPVPAIPDTPVPAIPDAAVPAIPDAAVPAIPGASGGTQDQHSADSCKHSADSSYCSCWSPDDQMAIKQAELMVALAESFKETLKTKCSKSASGAPAGPPAPTAPTDPTAPADPTAPVDPTAALPAVEPELED